MTAPKANLDRRYVAFECPMIGLIRPPCDAGAIQGTPCFEVALSQWRKQLTLAATILGSSMAFIDGSVVNVALPEIEQALRADATTTQWIVNAYLLLLGSLVLIGGSAADLYGRRRIFLLGLLIFTVASVACGASPNFTALIASRAVQGFGAALLIPASLAMLGATFNEHERSRAIVIWAGAGALMSAVGPVRGLAGRSCLVAGDLPAQRPARNCRSWTCAALRLREPRSARPAT
ncbi:MFS transporter [Bradyrhizobium japonicum]|uniref:MFS transporter n=1 Tax=Bradyrhizobium japonicum TaxID=375 RepID=UPI00200E3487|nr:MFS transporter [Bradyrhizobium japonicum]UQD69505.1 MFS transporter [Bradyrhizobium japonicum]